MRKEKMSTSIFRTIFVIMLLTVSFMILSVMNASETFAVTGEGTEQNPYKISSEEDWNDFAGEVRTGNTGGYYRLTRDITIDTPAGTQSNPFTGYFDGNSHKLTVDISDSGNDSTAPFRYIRGATIKNVKVDGTIIGKQYAAGLVGSALKASDDSASTIENNTVSLTINGGVGENAGGIVARQANGAKVIIRNCVFDGEFNGGKSYAGGILGWSEGGSLTIESCLFRGSYTGSGKFHPIAVKNNNASVDATIDRAYYANTAAPDMKGDTSHVLTDGILAYAKKDADVSNMHFYKVVKISDNNTDYYYPIQVSIIMAKPFSQRSDSNIAYTINADEETLAKNREFTANFTSIFFPNISLNDKEALEIPGTYSLIIDGKGDYLGKWSTKFIVADVSGSGTEADPYRISTADQWDQFAGIIRTGDGYDFKDDIVKLTADISVSTMAGTEEHPFSGTFDGQNKKLTSNISTEEQGAAPFRYIKGATIKNITAAGSVTGHEYSSGLVGIALGNRSVVNKIDHAVVTASVTANDYGSGVVGHGKTSTVEITNTVFSGKVTCNMFNRRYSGAGFLASNDGAKLYMRNCINKGSQGCEFYWWNPIAMPATRDGFETDVQTTYYKENVAKGNDYGYTRNVGAILVYTSALSGKISTKVTAADNGTYYYDDGVQIKGLKTAYGYTGSEINVGYQVKTSNDAELVKDTDYTAKFNKTVKDRGSYTLTITGKGNYTGSISASFKVSDQLSGSGTRGDPFIISSASDWNTRFKAALSNGYTYKDEFVKLTADISVGNNMVGTDANPFEGTFLGEGHVMTVNIDSSSEGAAPFAFVRGAKIQNLTVTGAVKGGNYSSGLIGKIKGGPVDIDGVTVNATVKSGQYLGGFIGHSYEVKSINITSCIFNGTINCTGSSGYGGGFTGWSDYPGYVIKNCLFSGNVTGKFKLFHPAGIYKASTGGYSGVKYGKVCYTSSGAPKGSGDSTATPLLDWNVAIDRVYSPNEAEDGCLYKQLVIGTVKTNCYVKASSGSISTDEVFVSTEYDRDEYETVTPSLKIECNGQPYIDQNEFNIDFYRDRDGEYVSVNSDRIGEAGDYMVKATGKGDSYCGSVSTTFKVVNFMGTGTEDDPYELYGTADMNNFAIAVNAGHSFKDKYVILQNDAECRIPVGDEKHQFKGTFYGRIKPDGSNVVLTADLDDTNTLGTAPFRWVGDGAVIHNINVAGSIKGGRHTGGLVGFAGSGSVGIHDVRVSATISNGDYIGGIVGHGKKSSLTISDCAFTGTITGGSSYVGGILGWSDGQKLTLENCVFAGRNKGSGSFHPIAVRNGGQNMNVSAHNVYYLNTQAPNIDESNIAASGTPVYKKTDFPEDKLLSKVHAADSNDYYAVAKVGTIAESYSITGKGIAPVPAISDVNGRQLKNGQDYTATYVKAGGDPVDKVTEAGEYTLVLKGNMDNTIGEQEAGTFTAEANSIQSVTLNKASVSLSLDEDENTAQLEMTVEPAAVVIRKVEWTSDDSTVATVDENGLVTATGIGSATITVEVKDETDEVKTASCSVDVVRTEAGMIVPPSKNILTYTGEEQELLNPGTASGGKAVYRLGTEGEFTESIPAAAEAGKYTVQYKVAGDSYHLDSQVMTMEVTIEKAEGGAAIEKMAALKTNNNLNLDKLVTGDTTGGVSFSIKNGDITGSSISTDAGVNTFHAGAAAGTCSVEVTVAERANFKEMNGEITVTIDSKELSEDPIEVTMDGWTYGDTGNEPVYQISAEPGKEEVIYVGMKRNGEFFIGDSDNKPEDAGDYSVYVIYEDDEYTYFGGTDFEISPRDISGAEVTLGESLTYTGGEQEQTISKVELNGDDITEFCRNGGNYAADGAYDPDQDQNQYTVVNAGKYILVVTADETSNYTGSVEKEFIVEKSDPIISKLPKAVKNLVYNGSEQLLIQPGIVQGGVMKYNMGNGDGFTEKLPAAIDAGTYQINCRIKGDVNHNNIDENISIAVTIDPLVCSVDQQPEAISGLRFTDEVQQLVTEGISSNGDLVYRIGDDESTEFSALIPKARKVGEYKVYFKAAARDDNHADSEVYGPVVVSIDRNAAEITSHPEAVEELVYNGEEQELVTAGAVSGGTMVYSFEENGSYSEEIPKAVDSGDYQVYYRIAGGDGYNDSDPMGPIQVKVNKAPFPGKIPQYIVRAKYETQVDISEHVTSDRELEYSIHDDQTDNHDCSMEGSVLTTGTGDGSCYVEIGVKGNETNYEPGYIRVNISNMTMTDIGVYQDDFIFGKGKADPKYDDYSSSRPAEALTIRYSGTLNNGESYGIEEEESQTAPTESGSYSVDVYYMIGQEVYYGVTDFSIKPVDIADAKVTLGKELKYNGSEQTQEVRKVELDGEDITDLCTVSDNKATKYGNYNLTVKVNREAYNYRGEAIVPFTVYPDDKTLDDAKKAAIAELEKIYNVEDYSGSEKTKVQKALDDAKSAIRKARTLDEIDQAKADADSICSAAQKNSKEEDSSSSDSQKTNTEEGKSSSTVKKANTFKAKGKTVTLSLKKLKKKTQKLKVGKVIRFTRKGQGKKVYKLVSVKKGGKNFKKYFTVNKKNGKLTVKKGLKKKGIYTVRVKVRATGNARYKASGWKTVKIRIRIRN